MSETTDEGPDAALARARERGFVVMVRSGVTWVHVPPGLALDSDLEFSLALGGLTCSLVIELGGWRMYRTKRMEGR